MPVVLGFSGLGLFVLAIRGRCRQWLQDRELPADEELQDRVETAMVSE